MDPITHSAVTMTNYIATAVGVAIAGVLLQFSRLGWTTFRSWKKRNSVRNQIVTALYIQERLVELRMNLSADRTYVFQLKNGQYYANDVSQLQVLCTHESVREGVASYALEKQAILTSQIPSFMQHILNDGVILQDVENTVDYPMKALMINTGGHLMMAAPFYGRKGRLEGWVGADYVGQAEVATKDAFEARAGELQQMATLLGFELKQTR